MTPTNFSSGRQRISSKFLLQKIGILISIAALSYDIIYHVIKVTIDYKTYLFAAIIIILFLAFNYLIRQKQIDYSFLTETLYVIDNINSSETEIPIENIVAIHYSQWGFPNQATYVIHFSDKSHNNYKVRLYPKLFDDSIDTIINDVRFKKPKTPITTWNFGWKSIFK